MRPAIVFLLAFEIIHELLDLCVAIINHTKDDCCIFPWIVEIIYGESENTFRELSDHCRRKVRGGLV